MQKRHTGEHRLPKKSALERLRTVTALATAGAALAGLAACGSPASAGDLPTKSDKTTSGDVTPGTPTSTASETEPSDPLDIPLATPHEVELMGDRLNTALLTGTVEQSPFFDKMTATDKAILKRLDGLTSEQVLLEPSPDQLFYASFMASSHDAYTRGQLISNHYGDIEDKGGDVKTATLPTPAINDEPIDIVNKWTDTTSNLLYSLYCTGNPDGGITNSSRETAKKGLALVFDPAKASAIGERKAYLNDINTVTLVTGEGQHDWYEKVNVLNAGNLHDTPLGPTREIEISILGTDSSTGQRTMVAVTYDFTFVKFRGVDTDGKVKWVAGWTVAGQGSTDASN